MNLPDFIWIIGNVGSGKSTLVKNISKNPLLDQHVKLNIDSFRVEYNQERTRAGENKACQVMMDNLETKPKILLESVGSWGNACINRFDESKTLIVILNNYKETSLSRIQERLKNPIQTPFPPDSPMKFTIESYSKSWDLFQNNFIEKYTFDRSYVNNIINTDNKNPQEVYNDFLRILELNSNKY